MLLQLVKRLNINSKPFCCCNRSQCRCDWPRRLCCCFRISSGSNCPKYSIHRNKCYKRCINTVAGSGTCYVNPIRDSSSTDVLYYNPVTSEIIHNPPKPEWLTNTQATTCYFRFKMVPRQTATSPDTKSVVPRTRRSRLFSQ